jgi:hypothetical protein
VSASSGLKTVQAVVFACADNKVYATSEVMPASTVKMSGARFTKGSFTPTVSSYVCYKVGVMV